MRVAIDIVNCIEKFHSFGYIHKDLKPDNIRIRNDGSIAIIDFGDSKKYLLRDGRHKEEQTEF
jgi:serine/threonine protein kinase